MNDPLRSVSRTMEGMIANASYLYDFYFSDTVLLVQRLPLPGLCPLYSSE